MDAGAMADEHESGMGRQDSGEQHIERTRRKHWTIQSSTMQLLNQIDSELLKDNLDVGCVQEKVTVLMAKGD